MMNRMSEEDTKKLDEVEKWLEIDKNNNLIFKEGTPEEIKKAREHIAKKYYWLD